MAIISRGLKATEFTHTCDRCDTVFTYNILRDLIPFYNNRDDSDAWIKCPVCGSRSLFGEDIRKLRRN